MIFQYQQLAQPFVAGSDPSALSPLSWLPHFPDTVPHRRTLSWAPYSSVAPFIISSAGPVRVSQLPVEVVFAYASVLTRVTQAPIEVAFAYAVGVRQVRVTQLAVEIIYPFGCFVFVPPLPEPCPVPNPEADDGTACPAPWLDSDPNLLT